MNKKENNRPSTKTCIRGECFCGQVKYTVFGRLYDARSCHCFRCRKAFSAQASAYALVKAEEFEWQSGEHLVTRYVGQHGFGLGFCSVCGSTLVGLYNDQVHGVTLGCVNGNPDIEIGRHIYVGSKAAWEVMPENVIQFESAPPAGDVSTDGKNISK
jgi:hypothetical protein